MASRNDAPSLGGHFMAQMTPDKAVLEVVPPTTAQAILCHVLLLESVLERTANRIADAHALTFTQWMALSCISHEGQGGITHSELSRRLMLSKAPITGVVDRLVKSKLARRVADKTDRRVSRVVISAEGLRRWSAVRDDLTVHSSKLFECLTRDEQETLLPLLARLLDCAAQDDPTMTDADSSPSA